MSQPHDLTDRPDDAFEARLRAVRPVAPRLDRDRLMYLAGRRSAAPLRRRDRFWPVMTIASWTACAVFAGLLATRPPEVVTEVRTVERVVERIVEVPTPAPAPVTPTPSVVAERPRPAPSADRRVDFDLRYLDSLRGPLTALASRPSLFENATEPVAFTSADLPAETARAPKTYSDLRRELLEEGRETSEAGFLRWF
ncbi:MAG TPA: hypothetical protein VF170_06045 [Planctomycetaceae bacterium]